MSPHGGQGKTGMASFRAKLLVAMMLVVVTITALVLYLAQHRAEAELKRDLEQQFQSELGFLLGAQEERRAAIAGRCRTLARSVRIRAAFEEDEYADLYLNAAVELRDVLPNDAEPDPDVRSPRAEFFCFLNASGSVISPPDAAPQEQWKQQLAMKGSAVTQQIGYIVSPDAGVREVIVTPIITTDTGDVIGALVLGFKPIEIAHHTHDQIKSGIMLNGQLGLPELPPAVTSALSEELARAMRSEGESANHFTTSVDGELHLVFFKRLNPGSQLAPAFQVCLYPLGDALARQKEMRWQIIGAGLLVILAGFGASHFISGRFSAPVERLAKDSAANVEQRERAEAALELTEQKYRSIFENAVEGIFLLAPDGRFLSANPALARIFGFQTPAELVSELDDPGYQLYVEPEQFTQFLSAAAEEDVADFETELVLPGGRKIWVSQNARAVRNADGTVLHFEGTLEDITERKRAADELLALNSELQAALATLNNTQQQIIQQERLRALGQMASGIAHDFNNTLMPILGFCELLLLSPALLGDPKKASRYLETIQTAAKDAASVVSRLREFYRPSKTDREFAPVNLKRLVEQAITLTKPKWKDQAQANGATIEVVLDLDAVPPVSGEESGLREVLTNLIFNAVDAMPSGGTLTVRTRRQGDTAALEIADTGTGMSEEVRQRCLEPFFSTKGERGTGLGLSMVFGIIQRHSGLLDIRSGLGKGTTFIITLPLQDAAITPSVNVPIRKPTRALRVLVVDDEAPVRDTLGAVLAIDGHEVEFATDGADGLRRFGASHFDLVVTDKAMPGMNGDQMAAAIKRVAPTTPIILLTGFGLFHDKSEFPGVDVLASKPIRIPVLREAITTAMQAA